MFQPLTTYWTYIVDLSVFVLCGGMVVAYQVRLRRHIRKKPNVTVQGMNAQARAAWVNRVMTGERDILAVQTFRNSTMAATLLASTAVILILAILNMLSAADKISSALHQINTWGSREPGMWIFKLMLLVVDFFVAFFAFSLAVRGYHHAGYLINVPMEGDHGVTPDRVVKVLDRASQYYSVGMRTYYLSVPLTLWLFGPAWMLTATLALLAVLNHLDHLPD
jgi:uncharacterized membrane protein